MKAAAFFVLALLIFCALTLLRVGDPQFDD